jgi:hypothetical protein
MHKTSYYLFCLVMVITLSSCSDNKYILYAKIDPSENAFNNSTIFCNGLDVGVADNSYSVVKLDFLKDIRVSKFDTVFLKQNPLGTKYFDIIKSNKILSDEQFYKTFDTINVQTKSNQFFLDSSKIKRIEKQFINTLDSLDAILK